ncbi:MAG: 40S ribosomal protein S30 [Amphiamblys sp. WSBS2006]|nr:MAG: 40S ribosomal protein S30 [Amphiamblys sp. WSBS2006]
MGKHGSLTQAGKVRNSTPKVAKQEKEKKTLAGRPRKRMLYKRRFVDATNIPGTKFKMNVQSSA